MSLSTPYRPSVGRSSPAARVLLSALAFGALLVVGCGPGAEDEAHPSLPEGTPVILVSIDTLRSDRLPAYGYEAVATPALDTLAAESILFERAYAHVPLTVPSHASLFTGLLPPGHGVRDNLGYRLDDALPTLAARLAAEGYATGGAVSAFVLRGATGIAAGFERWDDAIRIVGGTPLGSLQRPGEETLAAALGWLDEVAGERLFLFFHIYEPHSPYAPPEPYASRYADAYDGEVAAADAIVGRLLDALRDRGLYDDALVVLLSDHGEGLMDHGEQEHELLLHRELLQVPLLLKLPGGERAGERVAGPVRLVDVMPTVLRLLGLAVPEPVDGRSLLAPAEEEEPRPVLSENVYPRLHFGWSDLASLIDGRWHYIHGPDPELYDLVADPGETRNVLRDERRAYRRLSDRLASWERALTPPIEEDAETRDRLAALGYVGDVAGAAEGPLPDPKSRLHVVEDLREAYRLFADGELDAAAEAFRAVLEEEPRMVDAWEQLGRSLQGLGRLDEALAAAERALELSGGRPGQALLAAEIQLARGELDAADELARLALPHHEMAHDLAVRVALAREDLDEAEARLAGALEHRGSRLQPLILAAEVALRRERPGEALGLVRRVEAEFGDRTDTGLLRDLHVIEGKAHAALGDAAAAEEAFRRSIERVPGELEAYTHLAWILALQGRAAEAGTTLREMVERNPSVAAYAAAVRTLDAMGDPASAAAILRQARSRWPDSPVLAELES